MAFWSTILSLDVAKAIIKTTSNKRSAKIFFRILNSVYKNAGLTTFEENFWMPVMHGGWKKVYYEYWWNKGNLEKVVVG